MERLEEEIVGRKREYICSLTSSSSTSLGAVITLPTYLRMSGESCRIVGREGEGGTNKQSHH